jgi:Stress responsive A/B Barrel Domain
MVAHLVLFTPRPDLPPTEQDALITAFDRAIRSIPDVRDVRIGRRVTHGAGYEAAAGAGVDILVLIDFDDVESLRRYLAHPAHADLGRRFNEALGAGIVCDFEVGGLEWLKGALG